MMKSVTGIGGIFFRSTDPETLNAWYERHLGVPTGREGTVFSWIVDPEGNKIELWEPVDEKVDTP